MQADSLMQTGNMATLDPGQALTMAETALRNLMTSAYKDAYGPEWLLRVAPTKIDEWQARAETELSARGRKGVIAVPNAGLSYANFFDLVAIAERHWEPLSGALGKKASTLTLLKRLENLRNAVGHSRPLLPFERDLVSGIAGQIRNQVTIFMSAQDDAGDIYPRIESVTDSFGRRIESTTVEGEVAGQAADAPYVIVRPGDEVRFECIGVDPQGRQLQWNLFSVLNGHQGLRTVTEEGGSVQLLWSVDDAEVNESHAVIIHLKTLDTPYHRFGNYDHRAYFLFRVRPPVP